MGSHSRLQPPLCGCINPPQHALPLSLTHIDPFLHTSARFSFLWLRGSGSCRRPNMEYANSVSGFWRRSDVEHAVWQTKNNKKLCFCWVWTTHAVLQKSEEKKTGGQGFLFFFSFWKEANVCSLCLLSLRQMRLPAVYNYSSLIVIIISWLHMPFFLCPKPFPPIRSCCSECFDTNVTMTLPFLIRKSLSKLQCILGTCMQQLQVIFPTFPFALGMDFLTLLPFPRVTFCCTLMFL